MASFRQRSPGMRAALIGTPIVFIAFWLFSAIGSYQPLPKITITGGGASMMSLTNWKIDHTKLTADAHYSGYGVARFIYEVREDGVLKKSDRVIGPSSWIKGDTVEVTIYLPERPRSSTEVNVIIDGL